MYYSDISLFYKEITTNLNEETILKQTLYIYIYVCVCVCNCFTFEKHKPVQDKILLTY